MSLILELYLSILNEREWDEETENPDSFDVEAFKKVFGQLAGVKVLSKSRHAMQPSLYSIYIKNALGDYKGRVNTINTQTIRHVGYEEFEDDIEKLKKRNKFAMKKKDDPYKKFISGGAPSGETNDPDFSSDGYTGDGGDGGGGD